MIAKKAAHDFVVPVLFGRTVSEAQAQSKVGKRDRPRLEEPYSVSLHFTTNLPFRTTLSACVIFKAHTKCQQQEMQTKAMGALAYNLVGPYRGEKAQAAHSSYPWLYGLGLLGSFCKQLPQHSRVRLFLFLSLCRLQIIGFQNSELHIPYFAPRIGLHYP